MTWLFESGLTKEHLKIKRPKLEKRVLKTFTDSQIKAIINYKPKNWYEKRFHTMLLTDTGIRINEAICLERSRVDFDNLLLTVGVKEINSGSFLSTSSYEKCFISF